MNKYKWNVVHDSFQFWNHENQGIEHSKELSDKFLINNPSQCRFEAVLRALCNVVSELVEIEESKDKNCDDYYD